jgi:hypothetical protein
MTQFSRNSCIPKETMIDADNNAKRWIAFDNEPI